MKKLIIILLVLASCTEKSNNSENIDFTTIFEKSNGTETATYQETIQFYTDLADSYREISIREIGETDSGEPLHIVIFNPTQVHNDFNLLRYKNRIMLINNGIHPG